jgi:hypothetical protein
VGPATIAAAHRVLRTVLNIAVSERIIGRNPVLGTKAPRPKREEMRRYQAGEDSSASGVYVRRV